MAGRRKARVLPEPVRAAPKTSLPARRTGMDLAWMGVMVVMSISERARVVGVERSRVEKGSRPEAAAGVGVGAVGSVGLEGEGVDFSASSLGLGFDFEGLGLVGFDSGWSSSSSSSFSASSSLSASSLTSSSSSAEIFELEATVIFVGTASFFLFLVLFFLLLEAAAADVLVDILLWVKSLTGRWVIQTRTRARVTTRRTRKTKGRN